MVKFNAFQEAHETWWKEAHQGIVSTEQKLIDQAILDEQALEMAFEGNRFYDLMRRALWYRDNSIIANAVSKRDPGVGALLMNSNNWYLKYKGLGK